MVGVGITGNLALRAEAFDSNGLWLEITLTNKTAAFTVYAPATNAEGVYDLYFKTNLADNQDWTWLSRCASGQTNLTVSTLPPGQGFFQLETSSTIRSGFDQQILDRNDDGSTGIVPMGFCIDFFGNSNATLYVNNNGNVTFIDPEWEYIPGDLASLGIEVIAPFWADVDTRNTNSDVVTYGTNIVDSHAAFGVDWVNAGYFYEHADRLLSCQLVIIDRSDIVPDDFDMEFNYDKIQWEWGDASEGVPPRAGFSDGVNDYELPGSGVEGAFLDTNVVTGLIYHNLNSSVPGRYIFFFRNGEPLGPLP
ncbi:MAG: nidogen-like domain-containing protein [Verrucomicrobiia bacterium]